jgi:phenylpropionate dioxygenase-like ring-hydroxylating dioxygenase large terminal subunit
MGCDGHTVNMPGHQVRNFEPVKAYAVIERYGFVWVWPGDPSKVDPAQMPVFEWFENPKWAYGGGLGRFHSSAGHPYFQTPRLAGKVAGAGGGPGWR